MCLEANDVYFLSFMNIGKSPNIFTDEIVDYLVAWHAVNGSILKNSNYK